MEIKEIIERLANTNNREFVSLVKCTVLSVNESEGTAVCEPVSSKIQSEITVSLSLENGDNIECVPSVGSTVLIGITTNDLFVLLSVSDCDKIFISSNDLIQLNGGEFGGLVKVEELKTQLEKTNELVNAIANSLKNWTPVPSDGGAALKAFATAQIGIKTTGNFDNIENESITHGI
jgi:hypothetical protein